MNFAGPIAQIIGTVLTGVKSSQDKKRLALEQKKRAKELLNNANSVVTKQAVNDPAYKLKAFLAQSGVPGYEDYLQEIDANMQTQTANAMVGARSGAELLSYVSALEGGADSQKRNLGVANDTFKTTKKNNLMSTLYSMQSGFDAEAKAEKEMLNNAATKFDAASTLNKSAANEQIATTVGTAFNQIGAMGGAMGGSGNVSMGNLSSMFGKNGNTQGLADGNSQGSFKSTVPNITLSQQEANEMAMKKGITIQDLLNMGFLIQ